MSNQLIDIGDSVVFTQRYPQEPFKNLHNRNGVVKELLDDSITAVVEFNHQPGITQNVLIDDLEVLPPNPGDVISLDECEPYDMVEESESHEFGGMSRAQLIAHKLYAQENDPALDRSINKLIN
jgi:hypothetical protein